MRQICAWLKMALSWLTKVIPRYGVLDKRIVPEIQRNCTHFMAPEVSWPPFVPVLSQTIHSTAIHLISSRHALILSHYLCLLFPSSVCPSGVPSNAVCYSFLAQSCRVSCPFHLSWFYYPNHIWWGVKLFRWFSSASFYVFLLRLKYFHRHPIL